MIWGILLIWTIIGFCLIDAIFDVLSDIKKSYKAVILVLVAGPMFWLIFLIWGIWELIEMFGEWLKK